MQDIQYNDIRGSSLQIFARELISIPAAQPNMEEVKLSGRDGTIYKFNGTYAATPIKIPFNYIGAVDRWNDRWRMAKQWLSERNAKLIISDDAGFFYKITYVELDDNERTSERIGNFTAIFHTLDGLQYSVDGAMEYDIEDVCWNPYIECHPTYKIAAEGMCTLKINGKTMIANVGQNLTIDTDRMIAYREDGTLNNTPKVPTASAGTNNTQAASTAFVTSAISTAMAGITKLDFQVVQTLPSTGVKGTFYLIANSGRGQNVYDEYLWINNKYEKLGTREIDLSSYIKQSDMVAITNSEIDAAFA